MIPIVTAFHSKEGEYFKIPMLVFLAYSLIPSPPLGPYGIICSSTSMLLHLPPVLLFGICFKQSNLICLWWVIRFLTDVDRVRRKCRCTALTARLMPPAEGAFECCVYVSGHVKGQHLRAARCWPEGVGH